MTVTGSEPTRHAWRPVAALSPHEVVITRHGWEAIRLALAQLKDVSADLAADLSAGKAPTGAYAQAVGALSGAIAQLQEASEPRAAW